MNKEQKVDSLKKELELLCHKFTSLCKNTQNNAVVFLPDLEDSLVLEAVTQPPLHLQGDPTHLLCVQQQTAIIINERTKVVFTVKLYWLK